MKNTFEGKTIVTKDNAKVGMKVQRGRDWVWGGLDCVDDKPSVGEIIEITIKSIFLFNSSWVAVKWENGKTHMHRIGDNDFDIVFTEKTITNHL